MILIGLESLIDIRSVLALPALSNPRGGEEAEQSTSLRGAGGSEG